MLAIERRWVLPASRHLIRALSTLRRQQPCAHQQHVPRLQPSRGYRQHPHHLLRVEALAPRQYGWSLQRRYPPTIVVAPSRRPQAQPQMQKRPARVE
jgi:hypothetical protein